MPVGEADERRGGKANPIARSNNKKASLKEAFVFINQDFALYDQIKGEIVEAF